MAGVSVGESDNPVAIRVAPLLGVLFYVYVFFLLPFRFEQIEGTFEVWVPGNMYLESHDRIAPTIAENRVGLFWDEAARRTVYQLEDRSLAGDEELAQLLQEAHDDRVRRHEPDALVTIDAEAGVPWHNVVDVLNLCQRIGLLVEFALPSPVEPR